MHIGIGIFKTLVYLEFDWQVMLQLDFPLIEKHYLGRPFLEFKTPYLDPIQEKFQFRS